MPARNAVVVTYGEPLLRLSTGTGRQIDRAEGLDVAVGGAELNVAMALSALGRRARFVGAVPDSFLGDKVMRELRSRGVLVDSVHRVPGARLGLYFVEQAAAPRGHRVVYDRADTAFVRSEVAAQALDDAGTLIVSGITAALGHGPARQLEQIVATARERGVEVVVDVNYRALLWSPAEAAAALIPLLRSADVVICAARDARSVFAVDGSALDSAQALRERYALGANLVVVTDGSNGAAAVSADGQWSAVAPRAAVVDRFGAGDAFTAGLIWSRMAGGSAPEALEAAVALAAMACTVEATSRRSPKRSCAPSSTTRKR
ncbi:sugar kinase [Mycolicibacterium komossense]|uniref:Sugar kinase n=1 Tax=Mycolicibacterium komossense TaxID=1779 RepID=A0ABT3C7C2_9MYCO|nr:sugar kinase [Mycolicibacterium komossense]MCV7225384.1 sugar kinase [Mycolicibacterium komossense]